MESASLRCALVFGRELDNSRIIQKHPNKHHPVTRAYASRRFRLHIKNYKQSDFRDFSDYAKPLRLYPATDLQVYSEISKQNISSTLSFGESHSFVKVMLQTSSAYDSSLSDPIAGVLLCLIDTNGDSVLLRIPSILDDFLHFQRGRVDEFIFKVPNFGRLEAIWIGIETGQWRMSNVGVTVFTASSYLMEGNNGEKVYTSFKYEFEVDDILIGEGSDVSMLELRPCLVSESSGMDTLTLFTERDSQSTSSLGGKISNEESMKEYADLKLSLLSYDASLILAGTIISNLSAGENAAVAFFIGGIAGFLYLLLLQRSVDGLPSSPSISGASGGRLFGGLKGPTSILALGLGSTLLAAYSFGDVPMALTRKELLLGMAGFLACKLAVLLAAFKPINLELKEK